MNKYRVTATVSMVVEAPGPKTAVNDVLEALGVLVTTGLLHSKSAVIEQVLFQSKFRSENEAIVYDRTTHPPLQEWLRSPAPARPNLADR